eukprot:scaffold21373_cov29-Prasinocladus_malaysianus.AAC.1
MPNASLGAFLVQHAECQLDQLASVPEIISFDQWVKIATSRLRVMMTMAMAKEMIRTAYAIMISIHM